MFNIYKVTASKSSSILYTQPVVSLAGISIDCGIGLVLLKTINGLNKFLVILYFFNIGVLPPLTYANY